jgi:menaquinol-cytochrome c reductase iron-sulfur subunit
MTETSPDRRQFLSACTAALVAVISGLILAPVLAFVTSPLRRKAGSASAESDFADAGEISSIPEGKWTLRPVLIVRQDGWVKSKQPRSVWVLINPDAPKGISVRVLSPICTHLGCPIDWNAETSQFRCPCHGGIFDRSGAHLSGPPPRGMDPLDFQVRDNRLWVRWQDFRIGVEERVAVQV